MSNIDTLELRNTSGTQLLYFYNTHLYNHVFGSIEKQSPKSLSLGLFELIKLVDLVAASTNSSEIARTNKNTTQILCITSQTRITTQINVPSRPKYVPSTKIVIFVFTLTMSEPCGKAETSPTIL